VKFGNPAPATDRSTLPVPLAQEDFLPVQAELGHDHALPSHPPPPSPTTSAAMVAQRSDNSAAVPQFARILFYRVVVFPFWVILRLRQWPFGQRGTTQALPQATAGRGVSGRASREMRVLVWPPGWRSARRCDRRGTVRCVMIGRSITARRDGYRLIMSHDRRIPAWCWRARHEGRER
jgi:hypothetical protein